MKRLLIAGCLAMTFFCGGRAAATEVTHPAGIVVPTLRDRLTKDLRARRPVEFAFVDRVIELVEANILPLPVVERVYLRARKQREHRFQHFQFGLIVEARRLGINL